LINNEAAIAAEFPYSAEGSQSAEGSRSVDAAIILKANGLTDPAVVQALYRASQGGVKIDLVVQGMFCLRPGVPGVSDNIQVRSIIGQFLEHSREYYFKHASPALYCSSADIVERNLNRRVETLVEITNATVKAQIVSQVMAANLADVAQSWVMHGDGSFTRTQTPEGEFAFNCHRFFMENPSLSGRGSAGASDVPKLTHTEDERNG
jgi:polyphosphate kinase